MTVITRRSPPDDFDWLATIFLYTIVIILGVGMCFCLRRANRLIPNRFSFPLVERAISRQQAGRGFYDITSEEEETGLLSSYSDGEDNHDLQDAELIDSQNALQITAVKSNDANEGDAEQREDEEEEFSELQSHQPS